MEPSVEPFIEQLQVRLSQPTSRQLDARRPFVPGLAYGRHAGPPAWDARKAAVMVLLYPHQGDWNTVLTLRPRHLPTHAGQVSLPGGRREWGESSLECACRELQEELGVSPDKIRPLGKLLPIYVFNSNFLVTPWVAWSTERPQFVASPDEVEQVIEVKVQQFQPPVQPQRIEISRPGIRFSAPAFRVDPFDVWGATALLLAELGQIWLDTAGTRPETRNGYTDMASPPGV